MLSCVEVFGKPIDIGATHGDMSFTKFAIVAAKPLSETIANSVVKAAFVFFCILIYWLYKRFIWGGD